MVNGKNECSILVNPPSVYFEMGDKIVNFSGPWPSCGRMEAGGSGKKVESVQVSLKVRGRGFGIRGVHS